MESLQEGQQKETGLKRAFQTWPRIWSVRRHLCRKYENRRRGVVVLLGDVVARRENLREWFPMLFLPRSDALFVIFTEANEHRV